ncbi:MAG: PTS sugar transporter subunit IIA [Flavobacteriales bacterium]|jgi:Phosphotransferase system mannitol/fructose-specific IIA domain (Ntr-type)|nr:MAG: PTS sugar transporter subunit IIA [Bacteroidota bacterium]MBE2266367.1 PTS sugar transporter subunit IIA [Flavobacteriales bacterium]MBV6463787.1 PTS system fructose-specific EIIABC component [Chlorobiota bacterium]MBW7853658.1 PTS sugar transporter subunit IIA [Candidatus Kapabacteria bacterium]MCC6332108.1 PTS sugar transporter subunit IIA [Ignavibacteria bacterium]
MKITEILSPSCVLLGITAADKPAVLEQLVEALALTGKVSNKAELLRVITDREKLMSTGIGHGVALPHGKTNTVTTSIAAMATLAEPVDFDSLDDEPVNIVLMLVGTESNVGGHLRLLSRVSRMVGTEQFRTQLRNATSVQSVIDLFASYEEDRV